MGKHAPLRVVVCARWARCAGHFCTATPCKVRTSELSKNVAHKGFSLLRFPRVLCVAFSHQSAKISRSFTAMKTSAGSAASDINRKRRRQQRRGIRFRRELRFYPNIHTGVSRFRRLWTERRAGGLGCLAAGSARQTQTQVFLLAT